MSRDWRLGRPKLISPCQGSGQGPLSVSLQSLYTICLYLRSGRRAVDGPAVAGQIRGMRGRNSRPLLPVAANPPRRAVLPVSCHRGINHRDIDETCCPLVLKEQVASGSVGDDGAEAIAYHLASPWCMMIALRLITCNICDAGAVAFGGALAANTTLKVLDLDMNDFGSMGGQAIGVGLQSNCTLEELVLSNSAGPMEESFYP